MNRIGKCDRRDGDDRNDSAEGRTFCRWLGGYWGNKVLVMGQWLQRSVKEKGMYESSEEQDPKEIACSPSVGFRERDHLYLH